MRVASNWRELGTNIALMNGENMAPNVRQRGAKVAPKVRQRCVKGASKGRQRGAKGAVVLELMPFFLMPYVQYLSNIWKMCRYYFPSMALCPLLVTDEERSM